MLAPEGRVVMVTGANWSVGLAIARCLHTKGYTLSLRGRDRANNAAWVAATTDAFGRIDGIVGNVNSEDDDEDAFDALWAVTPKGQWA